MAGVSAREISFGLVSLGIGAAIGWFSAEKHLQTKYSKIAEADIEEMREHFKAKTIALEEREGKVVPLSEKVQELGYDSEREVETGPPANLIREVNVFEEAHVEDVWDYEEEKKKRDPRVPYIIHKDEYMEGEPGHEQDTLTYFEKDDVLCDAQDQVIEDQDQMVGLGNLSHFGHGSGDKHVLYIRNEELTLDIELIHSDGSYAEEVHGFLEHSVERMRRRKRFDDD